MVERTADGKIRTTEWEDIQYKHGNRVGKYRDKEDVIVAQKLLEAHEDHCLRAYDPLREHVEDKAERGGFEHDDAVANDKQGPSSNDEDEDAFLQQYRARRREHLAQQAAQNRFGRLRRIDGASYIPEITEASANNVWVVAALVINGNESCDALLKILELLSAALPSVKFVYLAAHEAIPNFPAAHAPLVLFYRDRVMVKQLTGIAAWGGKRISRETVMQVFADVGVVPRPDDAPDKDHEESLARMTSSKYYLRTAQ